KEIDQLKKLIVAPKFKNKDYVITDFGAVGDGRTKNTAAIKQAIEACSRQGGGRVVVPEGVYLTGAIYLKSNVNLHIKEGATVLFSRDSTDYPMVFTRWEGMECINFSPLFYAYTADDFPITANVVLNMDADYAC